MHILYFPGRTETEHQQSNTTFVFPTKSSDAAWLVVTEKGRCNCFKLFHIPFTYLRSRRGYRLGRGEAAPSFLLAPSFATDKGLDIGSAIQVVLELFSSCIFWRSRVDTFQGPSRRNLRLEPPLLLSQVQVEGKGKGMHT